MTVTTQRLSSAQRLAELYRPTRQTALDGTPAGDWFSQEHQGPGRWWPKYDEPIYSGLYVDVLEGRVEGVVPL